MKIGDTVEYIDDWKPGREWYLYDMYGDGLCMIVLIRNGSYKNTKNGEIRLNIIPPLIINGKKCLFLKEDIIFDRGLDSVLYLELFDHVFGKTVGSLPN